MNNKQPHRVINAVAPIRICDLGGWTDTWFAGHGTLLNVGVYPYVEVQIEVWPADGVTERVVIFAENFGDRYAPSLGNRVWIRHPLLEAALELMAVPDDLAVQVTIYSEAPPGASTGTSASVAVALIGALDRLTPGRLTPHEVAYRAHSVEVDLLGRQSGIQDQLCAAYGGINFVEMFAYPRATVSQLRLPDSTWWELERRLLLVFLGRSHDSSQVHEHVIRQLEGAGPDCQQLEDLRSTAVPARDALYAADWAGLGRAMIANTQAQERLDMALVGQYAHRVINIGREYGALGWKVNGAGGEGGSVTLLCDTRSYAKRALIRAIQEDNPLSRCLPIYLSRYGLRIWEGSRPPGLLPID